MNQQRMCQINAKCAYRIWCLLLLSAHLTSDYALPQMIELVNILTFFSKSGIILNIICGGEKNYRTLPCDYFPPKYHF